MPYLQVELDALETFGEVAVKVGLSEGEVAMGLLRLWRYCWKAKTAHVARERLGTFFPGDTDKLINALEVCDFVDRPAGRPDIHVRGAERRLGLLKAQSEGGRKSKNNLRQYTGKLPAVAGGQPEPQPVFQPVLTTGCAPAGTPALTSSIHSFPPIPNNPDEPVGALVYGLEDEYRKQRGTAYFWRQGEDMLLRRVITFGTVEILRRWKNGLKRTRFPTCDTVAALVEHFNSYGAEEQPRRSGERPSLRATGTDEAFAREVEHLERDANGDLIL